MLVMDLLLKPIPNPCGAEALPKVGPAALKHIVHVYMHAIMCGGQFSPSTMWFLRLKSAVRKVPLFAETSCWHPSSQHPHLLLRLLSHSLLIPRRLLLQQRCGGCK